MSSPLATAKTSAAGVVRLVARTGLHQRIPPHWRHRVADLVKRILGETAFQSRDQNQLVRGVRTRRVALTVALDSRGTAGFESQRLTTVKNKAKAMAGLTHLDAVVSPHGPPPGVGDSVVSRAVRVDPHATVPPLAEGISPMGFDRAEPQSFLTIVAAGAKGHPTAAPPPGWSLDTVTAASLPDPAKRLESWKREVQGHVAVIDHASHWANPLDRAVALTRLAGSGVPVVLVDADASRRALAPLLPAAVLDALAATTAESLVDPTRRERAAKDQWAAVHDHHSLRATWDRLLSRAGRRGLPLPTVSVVIASKRPELLPLWAHQVAAQQGVEAECVVALHGSGFGADHEALARSILGDAVTVVRVEDDATLGDALNDATSAAGGDLVVKWDDDDLYDRGHLADLVRTHEYSGATVVGKANEFIHLGGPDITVRRDQGRCERFSTTVAGGTLCIRRGDLTAVGGWQRSPRRVDSLLIEDVLAAGGLVYRASGSGYVMRRAPAGAGHTWAMADEEFLDPRFEQRRGLDLDFAGVDTPADALAVLPSCDVSATPPGAGAALAAAKR